MEPPDLPMALKADKLTITLEERGDAKLVARWEGRSDAREPGKVLEPFLARLTANAEATQRTLELRFERLEYFNSSTVGILLRLINTARERALSLEFTYDAGLRWQSVSFEALQKALAGGGSAPTVRIRSVDRVL